MILESCSLERFCVLYICIFMPTRLVILCSQGMRSPLVSRHVSVPAARGFSKALEKLLKCIILRESKNIIERNTALLVAINFCQHDIIQYLLWTDMQRCRCYCFFPIPPEIDHAQSMQEIHHTLNNIVQQNMSLLKVVVEKKLGMSSTPRECVRSTMLEVGDGK